MLDELFTYAKLTNKAYEIELSPCAVNEILLSVLFSFYKDIKQKAIEPFIDVPEQDVFIQGNEPALRRIFQNILKNCIEHGNKHLYVRLINNTDTIQISFENDYQAHEPIEASKVFDRFYKADEARSTTSTGLGLSIAKELVERLNGFITGNVMNDTFTVSDSNASKQLAKVEKDIAALDAKRAKLVDMRLEEIIDKETYEQKYFDLSSQIEQLQKQRESLQESAETESTMKKRIAEFRRTLEENEVLDTFDRYVFESIVEKVIVGGYDEDGNKDPAMLTFIYKTGFKNSLDSTNFKPPRKNSKAAKQNAGLCSHTTDEAKSMCSYHSDDTRRDGSSFVPQKSRQLYPH